MRLDPPPPEPPPTPDREQRRTHAKARAAETAGHDSARAADAHADGDPVRAAERIADGDPVRAAELVLWRVLDDPGRARSDAEALLRARPGVEAEVIGLRALGLAVRELGDLDGARLHLRTAIGAADAAGLAERAGQARLTLVGVLADLGRLDEALEVADQAGAVLRGPDAARLLGHRALLLSRTGRFAEAVQAGDQAVRRLRATEDPTFAAGLLNNLGLARAYAGDPYRAAADLTRAVRIADEAGIGRLAAMARVNLGFVAQRRGDLVEALRRYAEAEPAFTDATGRALALDVDHAATLLAAGLAQEARRVLTATVARLSAHPTDEAEARLTLAHAELACGDPSASAATARTARAAFTAQSRDGWSLLAEHAEIQARFAAYLTERNGLRTEYTAGPAATGTSGALGTTPADRPVTSSTPAGLGAPSTDRPTAGDTPPGPGLPPHGGSTANGPDAPDDLVAERALLYAGARASAERLAAWGWRLEAVHGRVIAARLALDGGEPAAAAEILAEYARPPRGGTAGERVVRWHATALYRLAHGNRPGAMAAVRAGLRDAAAYADALEATELRMHAAVRGSETAALGLRLALGTGRAMSVLAWIERGRAVTGRAPAVRPPRDAELAAALADLRRTGSELADAIATERPHGDALRRHQAAEARVRGLSRTAPHRLGSRSRPRTLDTGSAPRQAGTGSPPRQVSTGSGVATARSRIADPTGELIAALEDRAFLEFATCDGAYLAVTVVRGHCRVHELGRVETTAAVGAIRFAVHRLAQGATVPGRDPRAAHDDLAAVAGELDRALLPPSVRRAIAGRDLVLAPCGPLHALPWAVLPTLAHRPCTVTASAAAWLAARRADVPGDGRTVLVSGPGVPQAAHEITDLRELHPDAEVLTGPDATAAAVATALDGASLAHVSAHASHRPGNALLSEVLLADGALYGHDLAALASPPRRAVLSTCDAALGDVTAADRPLGPAAALLDGGAATVVASVAPVNDAETSAFMVNLHHELARGRSPAHALAAIPRTPGVLGFLCLGAGT